MTHSSPPPPQELAGGVTLDGLFRANVAARPDALALVDPPERASFTDGAPLRLTYAEADARVEKLARRLRSFGMAPGSVVALQLPNIAEAAISLLATLRAGLVAAPVPMLWRRSDLVAALAGIAPKALIALSRFGAERPAETVCEAAAELFDLSFPCAFGTKVPDGFVPLDRPDAAEEIGLAPAWLDGGAVSLVTFDTDAEGYFATARSDAQWLAAGLATLLEARIESGDTIVATLPPSSLAGIGAAFVPWLLSGGTLELVHGPAPEALAAAGADTRTHLVAPAAALAQLAGARQVPFASCIAVHRGPRTYGLDYSGIAAGRVVDLYNFGEIGTVALMRDEAKAGRPIPLGGIAAPSGAVGAPVVVEARMTGNQLWLRGPMVPREAWPPGLGSFRTARDEEGFTRTGYRCRSDGNGALTIGAGPDRVILVGGLRFGLDDLRSRFSACGHDVTVSAIEDPLLGERLHIETADHEAVAEALQAAGHSQLVIDAASGAAARRAAG